MQKLQILSLCLVSFLLLSLSPAIHAESVPPLINYQGKITDTDGNAVTGTQKLTVNIYDSATDGTLLWGPQVFATVPLINGYFNVILGPVETDDNGTALPAGDSINDAFTNGIDAYLEVQVDGVSTVIPRQRILSAPYAVQAETSEIADLATAVIVQGVTTEMLADRAVTNEKLDRISEMKEVATWSLPANDSLNNISGLTITGTSDRAVIFFYHIQGQFYVPTNGSSTSLHAFEYATQQRVRCKTIDSGGVTLKEEILGGAVAMVYGAPSGITTCSYDKAGMSYNPGGAYLRNLKSFLVSH